MPYNQPKPQRQDYLDILLAPPEEVPEFTPVERTIEPAVVNDSLQFKPEPMSPGMNIELVAAVFETGSEVEDRPDAAKPGEGLGVQAVSHEKGDGIELKEDKVEKSPYPRPPEVTPVEAGQSIQAEKRNLDPGQSIEAEKRNLESGQQITQERHTLETGETIESPSPKTILPVEHIEADKFEHERGKDIAIERTKADRREEQTTIETRAWDTPDTRVPINHYDYDDYRHDDRPFRDRMRRVLNPEEPDFDSVSRQEVEDKIREIINEEFIRLTRRRLC